MQPYLISGESAGSFQPVRAGKSSSRLVRTLVLIWLLGGLGFAVWKFGVSKRATEAAAPAATAATTALSTEDLLHHMDGVNTKISEAVSRLRRADDQIFRSLPAIDRNYLFVEKQHLQHALAANEAARRDLEQARQDSDLILNSLKEQAK